MKYYLLSLLLSTSALGFAQTTPIHQHPDQSVIFVDSVRVTSLTMQYVKPDDIKDVYVAKDFIDKTTNLRGAVFITTKNPKDYHFINLDEIKKTQGIALSTKVIYMVDNQFIKNTEYFKLPSSSVHSIVVTKTSEFDNLKNDSPNLSIVKIITKDHAPKTNGVMIRGTAEK